jgi:hypothetical protein
MTYMERYYVSRRDLREIREMRRRFDVEARAIKADVH